VTSNYRQRDVLFSVQDDCLVRTVISGPDDGRTYTHRCPRETFEAVAWAIEQMPRDGEGTTMILLTRQLKRAYTQVTVALEYLKERGIVDVYRRRSFPGTNSVHLDAMVEFHALAEEPNPV
jgi:hypothetical protein